MCVELVDALPFEQALPGKERRLLSALFVSVRVKAQLTAIFVYRYIQAGIAHDEWAVIDSFVRCAYFH